MFGKSAAPPTPGFLVALALLAVTVGLGIHTFADAYNVSHLTAGRGPVFYPRILLAIMGVLCLAIMVEERRTAVRGDGGEVHWRALAGAVVLTTAYVLAIPYLGFLIATIPYALALPFVFGFRNVLVAGLFAAVFSPVVWYLFDRVFQIVLPKSPWFVYF